MHARLLSCLLPAWLALAPITGVTAVGPVALVRNAQDKPAVAATAETPDAQLAAAQKLAARIESSAGYAADAPSFATEAELRERRYFLRETIRAYQNLQRNSARMDELRKKLDEMHAQADNPVVLDSQPPYSVLLIDQLIRSASIAQVRLDSMKSRQELVRGLRETLSSTLKGLAASIRQTEEMLAREDSARKAALLWSLDLERLRFGMQAAVLSSLDVGEEVGQIETAIAQAELTLAQRKVASIDESQVIFPERDIQQVKAELAAENSQLTNELTQRVDAAALARTRLDSARQELAQAEVARTGVSKRPPSPSSLEALHLKIRLAELDLAAENAMLDILRLKPGAHEIKRLVWDYRIRLHQERTPRLIVEARTTLGEMTERLSLLKRINSRQIDMLQMEITEQEQLSTIATMRNISHPQSRQHEHRLARDMVLRDTAVHLATAKIQIDRLKDELKIGDRDLALTEKASTMLVSGWQMLLGIWNYELFAAENTIQVDGKTVTGLASVSVGKVLRAIFMFAAGVLLALWLSRLVETLVVRRFGYDATQARIFRKWLFALGMVLLLLIVLMWVNIPLTVFAFLGGAIAIGLGFGMQNLLKNLICGLMLLFERPFKPGDLIEVGSVRGKITEIGIRSSTVRDANGIDTLIPNSTFVEQNVTNWTYDNPRVRFCIKIGVAYGSSPRAVAELLEQCVKRHGLVLEEPAPVIVFQNFGADALEFEVYFWMNMGHGTAASEVASDLRFIIEKTLAEHSIIIAYPQRDVHLDVTQPVRIRIDGPSPG